MTTPKKKQIPKKKRIIKKKRITWRTGLAVLLGIVLGGLAWIAFTFATQPVWLFVISPTSSLTPSPTPTIVTGDITIACWGDSLTEGTGEYRSDVNYPAFFSKITGYQVYNGGHGGWTSTQIAMEMLNHPETHGYPTIIWVGTENYWQPEVVKNDIATMVAALTTDDYLVLPVINGQYSSQYKGGYNYPTAIKLNNDLAQIYGGHYLDVRSYLVGLANPAILQDTVDASRDITPGSLRVDHINLNAAGLMAVARFIAQYGLGPLQQGDLYQVTGAVGYLTPSPTTQWICGDNIGTTLPADNKYILTVFGCWKDNQGTVHQDSGDSCVPGCLKQAHQMSLCPWDADGPACEEYIQYYSTSSYRYPCMTRLQVTNPDNGKSVVVVVIDGGPACWVEDNVNHAVIDVSYPASLYLFGEGKGYIDESMVDVEVVDPSTPLGPVTTAMDTILNPDIMILACGMHGDKTGIDCAGGEKPEGYGGLVPLSPYADWAKANGYKPIYINYPGDTNGGREKHATDIFNFVSASIDVNQDSTFILVGHSAGADSTILAASKILDAGMSGNISALILLDPVAADMVALIKTRIDPAIPVFFGDTAYDTDWYPPNYDNVLIANWGAAANLHAVLSVDQTVLADAVKFIMEFGQ